MNREIKFRYWTGNKMEYNVVVGHLGAFYALIDPNDTACLNPTTKYYNNDYLMQFTGLKDKNGKEIYEGDIISFGSKNLEDLFEVIWDETEARFMMSSDGGFGDWLCDVKHREVIGNIYENPELPT